MELLNDFELDEDLIKKYKNTENLMKAYRATTANLKIKTKQIENLKTEITALKACVELEKTKSVDWKNVSENSSSTISVIMNLKNDEPNKKEIQRLKEIIVNKNKRLNNFIKKNNLEIEKLKTENDNKIRNMNIKIEGKLKQIILAKKVTHDEHKLKIEEAEKKLRKMQTDNQMKYNEMVAIYEQKLFAESHKCKELEVKIFDTEQTIENLNQNIKKLEEANTRNANSRAALVKENQTTTDTVSSSSKVNMRLRYAAVAEVQPCSQFQHTAVSTSMSRDVKQNQKPKKRKLFNPISF